MGKDRDGESNFEYLIRIRTDRYKSWFPKRKHDRLVPGHGEVGGDLSHLFNKIRSGGDQQFFFRAKSKNTIQDREREEVRA